MRIEWLFRIMRLRIFTMNVSYILQIREYLLLLRKIRIILTAQLI